MSLYSKTLKSIRLSEENLQFVIWYSQLRHLSFSAAADTIVSYARGQFQVESSTRELQYPDSRQLKLYDVN